MKTLVSLLLCAALIAVPVMQTTATIKDPPPTEIHFAFVCIMGAASLLGGYVVYKIKSCRPKYYCLKDQDGNRFASNASRTERALNEWDIVSGPYNSAEACAAACSTNTAVVSVNVPFVPMRVMSSSNLVNWTEVALIYDDPDHFEWSATNSAAMPAMFYRIGN